MVPVGEMGIILFTKSSSEAARTLLKNNDEAGLIHGDKFATNLWTIRYLREAIPPSFIFRFFSANEFTNALSEIQFYVTLPTLIEDLLTFAWFHYNFQEIFCILIFCDWNTVFAMI